MSVLLLQGNALKIPIADKKVHCIITSPPFYGLRSYSGEQRLIFGGDESCKHEWGEAKRIKTGRNDADIHQRRDTDGSKRLESREDLSLTGPGKQYANQGQHCSLCNAWRGALGLEPALQEYIDNTVMWCREVWRVLRDDGVFWLNLGDSYNGSGGAGGDYNPGGLKEGQPKYPGRNEIGLKPKDLMLVPHRIAIALQNDGWWVRSDIVWMKPNPMPESVRDRPTKSHEYIFLLTKNERYYYDQDAIRERANYDGRHDTMMKGSEKYNAPVVPGQEAHTFALRGHERWPNKLEDGTRARNKRSVWTMTTKPYKGAHFATFPPELPETCIKAGTSEKGVCPVCGSQWARVVEHENMVIRRSERTHPMGRTRSSGTMEKPAVSKTIGWKPTCSHYDDLYRAFPRVRSTRKQYQQDAQNEWWKRVRKRPLDFAPCDRCKGTGIDPEDEPKMACYDCVGAGWVEVVAIPAIVCDPFTGSGTAPMVTNQLGRIGIGIDLSWDYLQLARERTGEKAWKEWAEGKDTHVEANLEELPLFKVQNK